MMVKDIRPALRAFLLSDSAVSTAVSASRIYPAQMPQGVLQQSIVYTLASEITDHHNQGPSGLVMARMQIDAWAQKHDDAVNLAALVKDVLDGYRGDMGSGAALVKVQAVFADSARYNYDDAAKLHRVSRDYLIHYEER